MRLIFIHGPAACGKLTVARELERLIDARLFHNHLTVDLAASLFEFGSGPFVELRETVWLEAFRLAAAADTSLIFTFHPEASVRPEFIGRTLATIESAGGSVEFVQLDCPEDELERRVAQPSRAAFGKLNSTERYRELRDAGAFAFPALPEPRIRIDTSRTSAAEAAQQIARSLARETRS